MNLNAFRFRIVASAVITAIVAVLAVWATVSFTLSQLVFPPRFEPPAALYRACLADPGSWVDVNFGGASITGYDEQGQPKGDGAAPLMEDFGHLEVGQHTVRERDNRFQLVVRMSERGDCSFLSLEGGPPPRAVRSFHIGMSAGVALSVLLVAGITYAFTVRPLLRRIERIRDAAVRVGAGGYRSAEDAVGDSLAEIGQVLDSSHARLEADRQELLSRHQALEQYLAEIAHDLRTPLGSLLLAVQEVHAEAATPAARRALSDVAYLTTLVENLHQAARLRHGLDPREGVVDLCDVLERLEVRFRTLGAVEGREVAAAMPPTPVIVRCTPVLAERAIANLLHNALVHGAQRVAAHLRVEEGRFVLVVMDDGPGVAEPADLSKRTFSDSADRPRGPGLGLAITNEIVARAGFSITYGRGEGGGLVVEIRGGLVREETG